MTKKNRSKKHSPTYAKIKKKEDSMREESCGVNKELLGATEKKPRKIGDWCENITEGTWIYEDDEISIYTSFWRHLDMPRSVMATIRWIYPKDSDKNYGTHTKISNEDGDIEDLLRYVGSFVRGWVGKQKDKNDEAN